MRPAPLDFDNNWLGLHRYHSSLEMGSSSHCGISSVASTDLSFEDSLLRAKLLSLINSRPCKGDRAGGSAHPAGSTLMMLKTPSRSYNTLPAEAFDVWPTPAASTLKDPTNEKSNESQDVLVCFVIRWTLPSQRALK